VAAGLLSWAQPITSKVETIRTRATRIMLGILPREATLLLPREATLLDS
jgi:hypothetical protein